MLKTVRNIVLDFPFREFDTVKLPNLFINIVREFKKELRSELRSYFVGISICSK